MEEEAQYNNRGEWEEAFQEASYRRGRTTVIPHEVESSAFRKLKEYIDEAVHPGGLIGALNAHPASSLLLRNPDS
jgi:hypothetical protein